MNRNTGLQTTIMLINFIGSWSHTHRRMKNNPAAHGNQKIKTYLDVRDLRDILGNVEAQECLFDPDKSFNEALAVAKASTAPNWTPRIQGATQTLKKMPTSTLKSLSPAEISPLKELYDLLKETLGDWTKLTDNKLDL